MTDARNYLLDLSEDELLGLEAVCALWLRTLEKNPQFQLAGDDTELGRSIAARTAISQRIVDLVNGA